MSGTLITSRDPKGLQATSIFEAAYNQAELDGDRAQRLNEHGGELKTGILQLIQKLSMSNQFANEETSSNYTYPKEYHGPKPIEEQIKAIAEIFDLDPAQAFEYAKTLAKLPEGAEGWFAIPSVNSLAAKHFPEVTDPAEKYCRAAQLVIEKLAASRKFYNYREGQIDPQHLRVHSRTAYALDLIAQEQTGGILIIAGQLGMRHRGKSVRRSREVFVSKEFGLEAVAGGSIALTHPERFTRSEELDMDLAGNEWSWRADGVFGGALSLYFSGGGVELGTSYLEDVIQCFGSASGFLSQ